MALPPEATMEKLQTVQGLVVGDRVKISPTYPGEHAGRVCTIAGLGGLVEVHFDDGSSDFFAAADVIKEVPVKDEQESIQPGLESVDAAGFSVCVQVSAEGAAAPGLEMAAAVAIGGTSGAVALGASGAVCGTAAGTTLGALLGLGPALFTFGLSIPVGAVVGGGAGFCVGAATGGSIGLLGGGAAGYYCQRSRRSKGQGCDKDLSELADGADKASNAKSRLDTGVSLPFYEDSPGHAKKRASNASTSVSLPFYEERRTSWWGSSSGRAEESGAQQGRLESLTVKAHISSNDLDAGSTSAAAEDSGDADEEGHAVEDVDDTPLASRLSVQVDEMMTNFLSVFSPPRTAEEEGQEGQEVIDNGAPSPKVDLENLADGLDTTAALAAAGEPPAVQAFLTAQEGRRSGAEGGSAHGPTDG